MTNRRRQNSLTMIIVLFLVALAGVAIVLLTRGSGSMLFDLHRRQYNLARSNLAASTLAWAEVNAGKIPPGRKKLSLDGMSATNAALHVTIEGDKSKIRIRTTCRFGRKLIENDSIHPIRNKP
ncbi:MAG: hypothetical protein SVV80_10200 [Planctomycetota bacterium]|nr:hypothetical protein [Planctomycetota bacterium]